jgi:hypothetical protein
MPLDLSSLICHYEDEDEGKLPTVDRRRLWCVRITAEVPIVAVGQEGAANLALDRIRDYTDDFSEDVIELATDSDFRGYLHAYAEDDYDDTRYTLEQWRKHSAALIKYEAQLAVDDQRQREFNERQLKLEL